MGRCDEGGGAMKGPGDDGGGAMREWSADRVAQAAGARVVHLSQEGARGRARARGSGPIGICIDSRELAPGELFVGLAGKHVDGGRYAADALRAGAWGVLVTPEHARACAEIARAAGSARAGGSHRGAEIPQGAGGPRGAGMDELPEGWIVLVHEDPLAGLQALAKAWLGELRAWGAKVVAITGSTGKTSTKDILAALLGGHMRTVASVENRNTEIGMPLTILGAPAGTEALILEMAMRGKGQIAQLAEIAQPDVGVIVNVGPVHLEQMGSLEAVAAAKGELIAGCRPGATVVVPADEPLLEPYLRDDTTTVTFGSGGDVELAERGEGGKVVIVVATPEKAAAAASAIAQPVAAQPVAAQPVAAQPVEIVLKPSFQQEHNLRNLLAAVAAARALGVTPEGELQVRFSQMRGERIRLLGGVVVIEDCYNANPMSMRAAIDDLAETAAARAHTRRVAVLGDMLELGSDERRYHREIGEYARARGVEVLVTVGPRAAEMAAAFGGSGETHSVPDAQAAGELMKEMLEPGDTVLVKGSRGVGLERVGEALRASERVLAGG